MNPHEERLEKAIKALKEKAVRPLSQKATPLAEELQTLFYGLRAEEFSDVPRLKEIHSQIRRLDTKIMEFAEEHKPTAEDESFVIQWLYKPQAEIFANWSMKVGYILDDLEKRTDAFSLHVDRQLATPWSNFNKVKAAYEDVLRRAKKLIDDYYDILEFKTCHSLNPRQSALRPPKDIRDKMIQRIDSLAQVCLDRVQKGIERMRELFFKFSDHRFAEEAAIHAKTSVRASMAGVVAGSVTVVLALAGLIVGIVQLLSPTTIQTIPERPLEVRGDIGDTAE